MQGDVRGHSVQIVCKSVEIDDRDRCLELFEIRCHCDSSCHPRDAC